MNPQQQQQQSLDPDHPQLPTIKIHHPSSPRHSHHHHHHHISSTPTPTAGARRKIGVAVDPSDESAYAVKWAVDHYIRPGDAVVLLHVSPTSVLFGADWGPLPLSTPTQTPRHGAGDHHNTDNTSGRGQPQGEDDFAMFTASKAADISKPLKDAQIPYKIHIVKDHDMKERLCLEVERLGLSVVIMGSRGFGASKRGSDGRLGSVSDYCVHHCVCPVVVVRFPEDKDESDGPVPVVNVHVQEDEEEVPHLKGLVFYGSFELLESNPFSNCFVSGYSRCLLNPIANSLWKSEYESWLIDCSWHSKLISRIVMMLSVHGQIVRLVFLARKQFSLYSLRIDCGGFVRLVIHTWPLIGVKLVSVWSARWVVSISRDQ
ncbi:Universal stress protein PHOS32 [Linum grandiflorum]